MNLKLIVEPKNALSFQTLMEDNFDVTIELICLASNNRKKVCGILYSFLCLKKLNEKKTYNILIFMLDSRFKNLRLVSFFNGCN
jgi:hypothetical protein